MKSGNPQTQDRKEEETETWVWCDSCSHTRSRSNIEELVRLQGQEKRPGQEIIDTDEIAREQADLHERACPENGSVHIAEKIQKN